MITMNETVFVIIEKNSCKFLKYNGKITMDNLTPKLSTARTYDTLEQAEKVVQNINTEVSVLVELEKTGRNISRELLHRQFIIRPVFITMNGS